jgi:lipid-binding SYLF domain-containing protein
MNMTRCVGFYLMVVVSACLVGCNTTPRTAEDRQTLHDEVNDTVASYKRNDPDMQRFFDHAYAYAVLPAVGEGAFGVGGAYGHGEVYQGGRFVGHCNMTQATVGAQVGGQKFSEIIFFQNKGTFDAFTSDELAFDAKASAVAAAAGASSSADYEKGVLVFTQAQGGLMLQAAVGGQKFNYSSDVQTTDIRP